MHSKRLTMAKHMACRKKKRTRICKTGWRAVNKAVATGGTGSDGKDVRKSGSLLMIGKRRRLATQAGEKIVKETVTMFKTEKEWKS
mgnify:CR=1 FL=1